MDSNSTSRAQELAGVSSGTRGLSRNNSRNATSAPQHERRKSIRLLGEVVDLDEWLDWRVKWGQRGIAVCAALATVVFVLNDIFSSSLNYGFIGIFIVCFLGFLVSGGMVYYKNVSLTIARRLLKEVNVVIILVLGVCTSTIDYAKPHSSASLLNTSMYFLGLSLFVFLDALKKKSRVFVLVCCFLFILATLYCIYDHTFTETSIGVILFQYGDDYVFRKRSIKRSCFVQILLFSLNGMWTMFKDKKMEKMMFATGNIYRETGTASKYVEDRKHTTEMQMEKAESMV